MIKLSVYSTRDFHGYNVVEEELEKEQIDVLVTGGRIGVDELAQEYAIVHDIQTQVILPDYARFGDSANYYRNLQIIEHSNRVIVFWDQNKKSTIKYIDYAKKMKIPFRTVFY